MFVAHGERGREKRSSPWVLLIANAFRQSQNGDTGENREKVYVLWFYTQAQDGNFSEALISLLSDNGLKNY